MELKESGVYDNETGVRDFSAVNWNAARVSKVRMSDVGSGGVIFVHLELQGSSGVLVVKGSQEPAREVFLMRVARLLNIPCPGVRVLGHTDPDYLALKRAVNRGASGDEGYAIARALNKPQLLVMEFVPGVSAYFLSEEDRDTLFSCKGEKGRQVLHSLAKVMALDALTNNFDRVPLLSSNNGNFDNVMLQPGSGQLVAIDNMLQPIHLEISGRRNEQYDLYMSRLRQLLVELKKSPEWECRNVATVRGAFSHMCRVTMTPEDGLYLQIELASAFQRMSDTLSREVLTREKELVAAQVTTDWSDVWRADIEKVNVDFLCDTLGVVQDVFPPQRSEK